MRRRWKILLLGACGVVAVVAVCFFCLRDNEPSYNGRTLSEWLEMYDSTLKAVVASRNVSGLSTSNDKIHLTEEAVRAIGTNAVPCLLQWYAAADAPVVGFLVGHPKIPGAHRIAEHVLHKGQIAYWGFDILGTNALVSLQTVLTNPDIRLRTAASNAVQTVTATSRSYAH